MPSKLSKAKEFELMSAVRDKGKMKPLMLTIDPNGWYTLRPKGTRRGGAAEVTGLFEGDYKKKLYERYI